MNDLDFEQQASANPFDESPEFLAAIAENPQRQQYLDELKSFETGLSRTVQSVHASEQLKQRLLNPEALIEAEALAEKAEALTQKAEAPSSVAANDNHFWTRKVLPVAACLLLAIGVAITYGPTQESSHGLALEEEVFSHIYMEAFYLEEEGVLSMPEVNQAMDDTLGVQFNQSAQLANLEVHVASECWVDKENAIHMVVKGSAGAVTVFLIPNAPLEDEMNISDERFEGLITPTPMGNLVVIGEKGESIAQYSKMLASNITWQL